MRVELTRFRVQAGKQDEVAEWMEFLRSHMEAVQETLEPEQMYVETIFSETLDGIDYLYWYSVRGEGGTDLYESSHWLDAKHIEFWKSCIDPAFTPVDLTAQVTMMPARVIDSMHPLPQKQSPGPLPKRKQ
ncbi:DUF6176 family protein [Arthrobacter sp. zg-Y820]|uniref:DUF6176 family protein n=1 Tax=unclassified Arthrobacter TaxID=235627 RepID=UPI001E490CAE|nr:MULTISPECIES: DUF6176 family protein [unclassified Arthrobacter]MCC9196812.1 DUF6176 family protein [Arthrobacter sp. zg-Y820]MDK1279674.1 DUF6176 family protein [Arthrobacter sp. zg.Y820]WIB07956.1 DUF6176 family protein [Arthrobacter sp. zg-Y820]